MSSETELITKHRHRKVKKNNGAKTSKKGIFLLVQVINTKYRETSLTLQNRIKETKKKGAHITYHTEQKGT